ncbi:MAG: ROK family protein [Deinococcus sp.]|nr:ROK family protein [Deinococcus sp.]
MRRSKAVLALDLGGTKILGAVVGPDGAILHTEQVPTKANEGGDAVMSRLAALTQQLQAHAEQERQDILAVGLATPGLVDSQAGRTIGPVSNLPGWGDRAIGPELSSQGNLPVQVVNDANAAALGEGWLGAARGCQNYLMVTIGTGIGGGIVADGRLVAGAHGGAGEVGHMVLERNGPRCPCGWYGCWEALAAGPALEARLRASWPGPGSVPKLDALCQLAKGSHQWAQAQLREEAELLALGVGSLLNLLDPELILLGGGVMAAGGETLLGEVQAALKRQPTTFPPGQLVLAKLGQQAGVIGAAYAALERAGAKLKR